MLEGIDGAGRLMVIVPNRRGTGRGLNALLLVMAAHFLAGSYIVIETTWLNRAKHIVPSLSRH